MILLTGSTGLVGSRILFDLTARGVKVRALRRAESGNAQIDRLFNGHSGQLGLIEWVTGDVTDLFSLEEAMDGIDTIIHSAAFISFHPSDRKKMHKVNVEGTANLVNLALEKGIGKFCHISSVAALGRSVSGKMIDEENLWKPSKFNSSYAISKYGAEREVWRGMEEGLNGFIVNPSIIIGPGDWKSGSSQLFRSVYNGLPFYSTGVTGYVDVRDVSRCVLALLDKNISGERFILNSENVSYRDMFFMIADAMHKRRPFILARPWMAALVWRFAGLFEMVIGKRSMITKETARSGMEKWYYTNEKIRKLLPEEFLPIQRSVEDTVKVFLKEKAT